jgi:hypothetical protein
MQQRLVLGLFFLGCALFHRHVSFKLCPIDAIQIGN